MNTFDDWMVARRYAPTTRRTYAVYARKLDGFTDPASVSPEELGEFLETLPNTAASHRQARKALTLYMRYLGREPNPALKLPQVSEPHRLPRPLTEDEHRRWVAAAHTMGGRHELAGTLLASTGCRQIELRKSRWEDFVLVEPGSWRIRGKGARRAGPIWRSQPLHPVALRVVQMASRWSEWLFPGPRDHLSDTHMRNLLIEIGEHAGLGRVTPHRLRHSVATLALARSGDLRAVQTLLGHRNISSTVGYTQLVPGRLQALVDELPV